MTKGEKEQIASSNRRALIRFDSENIKGLEQVSRESEVYHSAKNLTFHIFIQAPSSLSISHYACSRKNPKHLLFPFRLRFVSDFFSILSSSLFQVTRKLFTMLLSLFVYNHQLSPLQWIGVVTVFLGIGVEARESRKAKLKSKTVSKENSKKPSISTSNGKFQSENGEQKVNGNGIENGKGGKIE